MTLKDDQGHPLPASPQDPGEPRARRQVPDFQVRLAAVVPVRPPAVPVIVLAHRHSGHQPAFVLDGRYRAAGLKGNPRDQPPVRYRPGLPPGTLKVHAQILGAGYGSTDVMPMPGTTARRTYVSCRTGEERETQHSPPPSPRKSGTRIRRAQSQHGSAEHGKCKKKAQVRIPPCRCRIQSRATESPNMRG